MNKKLIGKRKIVPKLDIDSGDKVKEIKLAMESMICSPGWKIMEQIFESNISLLEREILDKVEVKTGRRLTDPECDQLRDKLGYLKNVINTPQNYITMLKGGQVEPREFDPFYKTVEEMRQAP